MEGNKKHYFYGHEVSEYAAENGFVDYRTLAKCFDAVLNNEIIAKTCDIGYWEQESGFVDNSEQIEENENKINKLQGVKEYLEARKEKVNNNNIDLYVLLEKLINKADDKQDELQDENNELERRQYEQQEIFQYYIIDDNGAALLKRETNEIVFYNKELDMYVWGVTHWGASWDYVLTDISIEKFENRYK